MRGGLALRLQLLRVAVDETSPAIAMEGLPLSFRLSEPVGDGVERCRVRAQPEMGSRHESDHFVRD